MTVNTSKIRIDAFLIAALLGAAILIMIPSSVYALNAPSCPLSPQVGRTIVMLGANQDRAGVTMVSSGTVADATFGPVAAALPAGTYNLMLASYDNHVDKPLQVQPNESWFLRLYDAGNALVASTNPVSDLPQNQDFIIELVQLGLVVSSPIVTIDAFHAAYPDPNPNSIDPICAAFDPVPPPPPPPACPPVSSGGITINICNSGSITNSTSAKSSTGGNTAGGSVGGRGGAGGDISSSGNNNNGGASGGSGGNGGNGGAGGLVATGDATANADTVNDANSSDVNLEVPEEMNSSSIAIIISNLSTRCDCGSSIGNSTRARASTGENLAEGSSGGDGGSAGDITAGGGDNNNGGASTGNGGRGGAGGLGAEVRTGGATSSSGSFNSVNRTIIRVSR